MDDVATRRLNEHIQREQRTIIAWKEKYGRRNDFIFPDDGSKASRLRELKGLTDKFSRAEFTSMDDRVRALEQLRAAMAQCVVDVDDSLGR
jgi:hypothetical protein